MTRTSSLTHPTDPVLVRMRASGIRQLCAFGGLLAVSAALCALTPPSPRERAQARAGSAHGAPVVVREGSQAPPRDASLRR